MNRTLTVWLSVCAMVSGIVVLGGCGGGAPVVIGEQLPAVAIPTYACIWLEQTNDGTTTKDLNTYYFDASNNLVAIKLNTTVGSTSTTNGTTAEILATTIVKDQDVSITKITGTVEGTSYTAYMNAKITAGTLTRTGDAVTATYTVRYSTGTESFDSTITLTGTASEDGRTLTFTHTKMQSTPAQTSDTEKDINSTWTLQSGNALL